MIAHLDLDAFFASVEQRDNYKLRGKPVVVSFATPQGEYCNRGVVSAASYEARTFGIHSGMSLWEAKKRYSKLIIVGGNSDKYQNASNKTCQIICRYSSEVEPLSLDEFFFSFFGYEDLYQDLVKICQIIKKEIQNEVGISASIGLATNKLVAKIASDFKKPDGLTVVSAGCEREFLAPLSCEKLYGLGPATAKKLFKMGIKTVGELAETNKNLLISIFGKYGETLWQSANGFGPVKIISSRLVKSVGRSTTFPFNCADYDSLAKNLVYLSEKVSAALVEEQVAGSCVTLTLRDEDFKTWSHQRVLTTATSTPDQILNLVKKLLDASWDKVKPLRLLGISVSQLTPVSYQLSLLQDFEKKRVLQKTTAQIREKFGFWSVRPASILDPKLIKRNARLEINKVL